MQICLFSSPLSSATALSRRRECVHLVKSVRFGFGVLPLPLQGDSAHKAPVPSNYHPSVTPPKDIGILGLHF